MLPILSPTWGVYWKIIWELDIRNSTAADFETDSVTSVCMLISADLIIDGAKQIAKLLAVIRFSDDNSLTLIKRCLLCQMQNDMFQGFVMQQGHRT